MAWNKLIQRRTVFVAPLPTSQMFAYGVVTNDFETKVYGNIYDYVSESDDDFENAMKSDVLIWDLALAGGGVFNKSDFRDHEKHLVWRTSAYQDLSGKSSMRSHYAFYSETPGNGQPPNKKYDLTNGAISDITNVEFEELLASGAGGLGTKFPQGISIVVEEFLLHHRKHKFGQHLRHMSKSELTEVFAQLRHLYDDREAEQFQKMWLS